MTTRAIFVVNSLGEWKDTSGSSRGVSNSADLQHLITSRRWCDLILSSGLTVRSNKYSPTQKPLWIISKQAGAFDELVRSGAQVMPASATEALFKAKVKFQNILCEFGPKSLNEVIEADLLDEFDLSITGNFDPEALMGFLTELPVNIPFISSKLVLETKDLVVFRFILR